MNKQELIEYIDNNILLGNIVREDSPVVKYILDDMDRNLGFYVNDPYQSVGCVCIDDRFYIKKDGENKIHLVHYVGDEEEIDLGDYVDIIDSDAFRMSKHIKYVAGKTVVKLDAFSFSRTKIKDINFPNLQEIGYGSFGQTYLLENITLNKIKVIPKSTFFLSKIKSFRGDEVEVVEEESFDACENLEELILPKVKKYPKKMRLYDRDKDKFIYIKMKNFLKR